jgi:shikimate dehydrogenase
MDVYGVLGYPVAHSRSPAMHRAGIEAAGLNAVYGAFPVPPERLAAAVHGLAALGIAGANVTLPHKRVIAALIDEVEPDARLIGAVNTLVRHGDALVGINTDAPGLVRSLEEADAELEGARVVILGAGGAARAAAVGLARAGAERVVVAARRPEQADELRRDAEHAMPATAWSARELTALEGDFADATLIIQATSATLKGRPEAERFAAALPFDRLPEGSTVCDLVYAPRQTTVLEAAAARGHRTVDGLGMLLHQGTLSFERWFGRPAPVDAMRSALERTA